MLTRAINFDVATIDAFNFCISNFHMRHVAGVIKDNSVGASINYVINAVYVCYESNWF